MTLPESHHYRVPDLHEAYPEFDFLQLLSENERGAIFVVRDRARRRRVALKLLRDLGSPEVEERFRREYQILFTNPHEHLVTVYHYGRRGIAMADGARLPHFFYTMEVCHSDLARELPHLSAAERRHAIDQFLWGLSFLHTRGIAHRDLKPHNLFAIRSGASWSIKIGDFGIAKARSLTIDSDDRRLLGKYAYVSPEQARLEPTDHRSDLYALGLVLWEMLVGQRPRPASLTSREAWLEQVRTTPLPPVATVAPGLPPMLASIIDRAVAMAPEDRYADAGTMGYDLEYFMYHQGYGPTIVTLASYLATLFPGEQRPPSRASDDSESDALAETTASGGGSP